MRLGSCANLAAASLAGQRESLLLGFLSLSYLKAVPMISISVHSCASGRGPLCGSCCIDILPLFIHPLSMTFMQGPVRLAQSVERKALHLSPAVVLGWDIGLLSILPRPASLCQRSK